MQSGKNRKTALITGAGAGIGREMARFFFRAGYDILAVSLVKDELESLKNELDAELLFSENYPRLIFLIMLTSVFGFRSKVNRPFCSCSISVNWV